MSGGALNVTVQRRQTILAVMLAIAMLPGWATAQEQQDNRVRTANYELAARFAQGKINDFVYGSSVTPRWLKYSDRFWYQFETAEGRMWYLVDPARKTKVPLFDRVQMARDISRITRDPYDHLHLPISSIEFVNQDRAFRFDVTSSQDAPPDTSAAEEEREQNQEQQRGGRGGGGRQRTEKLVHHFEYVLATRTLRELDDWEEPTEHPRWANISPDRQWVVFARAQNLWMMDIENYQKVLDMEKREEEGEEITDEEKESVEEIQLTTDGERYYGFGTDGRGTLEEYEESLEERQRANVIWSPDSKKFAVSRTDQRKVKDLWVINSVANPRPTLETYKYAMPGEEDVPQDEIWVFDIETRAPVQIDEDRFTDQTVSLLSARGAPYPDEDDWPDARIWYSEVPNEVWFMRTSRDLHRIDVCIADPTTGEVRTVVEERLNTYVETQQPRLLRDRNELIWWSERDGWGHYYLYGLDGTVKRQLTSGAWACRGIQEVDEAGGVMFFQANGKEPGEDPYYEHLYRVNLDGSGLRLLTPGDASHSARMNPEGTFFVDSYSRVDSVPRSELFNNRGEKLLDLEEADLSRLMEVGFQFPETFVVKADDGITDLWGVLYKPFDFDPAKKYPIIAYVYPGPQTESVQKTFSVSAANTIGLAQLGFIVVTVGNRGGHPNRSKWYHNYSYGDLRDYGLADKKTAIEQLAARHPYIDIDRVGIFGHSGGGFMSTAAMLVYPDFFKVAVSSSGNHDNAVYNKWWSEKHHGVKEVTDDEGNVSFEYDIDKNQELAANLKGHLLLTTGDYDNNVHPAGTLRMASALIQAGKRFDLFIFPGARHSYGNMGNYWFWLRADYFCKHLLGDYSQSVDMIELLRELDQSPDGGNRGGR